MIRYQGEKLEDQGRENKKAGMGSCGVMESMSRGINNYASQAIACLIGHLARTSAFLRVRDQKIVRMSE